MIQLETDKVTNGKLIVYTRRYTTQKIPRKVTHLQNHVTTYYMSQRLQKYTQYVTKTKFMLTHTVTYNNIQKISTKAYII